MEKDFEQIEEYFKEELLKGLEQYTNKLMELYKSKLRENGVVALGKLINSIKPVFGEISPDEYVADLELPDYGEYIENGRMPGRFPPPDAIENWIRVKPVTPQPYQLANGKTVIPTEKQLAFLIGRKIAQEGIKPRPYLQESKDELKETLQNIINEVTNKTLLKLQEELPTIQL